MKNKLCFLAVVALGLLPGAPAASNTTDDLDAKIAQLSKKGTTAKEALNNSLSSANAPRNAHKSRNENQKLAFNQRFPK